MKTPIFAIAAASLAITASPALAGHTVNHVKVHHGDLNLATQSGVKALEGRIDSAARKACNVSIPTKGTRLEAIEARSCVAKAKAGSMRQFAAVIEQQRLGG